MRLAYPIDLAPMSEADGGGWLVTFPDWGNAVTDGDSPGDALTNAIDCLETMIDYALRKGRDIPEPSPAEGRHVVVPESDLATKAALWRAFRASELSEAELAARLGLATEHLHRRLFHPRARPKPELVRAAATALGKRVVVEVLDAA